MSDFADFKRYFKEYQKRFGLNGYKVYFGYEPLNEAFADIITNQGQMVATVRLNSKDKKNPDKDIRRSAKHEAIHLLLARLEYYGRSRYVQLEEITEAEEECVFRLEGLIKD